jgi:putative phosphoserine phosphatase / 1-acylglycerol-3-phosphate O-acyltransferase
MVPIVIHNSGDVAPKGDFVFRAATVEVEVLPPVDTSAWRVETIDEHVREVRNMFARVLGQAEDKPQGKPHKAKTTSKSTAKKKKPVGKRKAKPKSKVTARVTRKAPVKKANKR